MTILTLDRKKLEKEIGKIDSKMENRISMFGTPVDELTDKEVSVEIFPNRPDLVSFQGFVRGLLAFLGKKSGLREYKIEKPEKNFRVVIDKSVKKVRPFTECAIVRGLKLDNQLIKDIIDVQEKMHSGFGRERKKIAIGIYPLEEIKLPIKFTAKNPDEIKFVPLESNREMTGRQILNQHPAGREYAHLLKDEEVFPVFEDANGEVLSMPPIINSNKTGKVGANTSDVFIECSGFNPDYLKKALNMLVCAFADMGGKLYGMEIVDDKKHVSPSLEPEEVDLSVDDLNKTLGLKLTEKEIEKNLGKMGIGLEGQKALVPAYRTDILHEIDLSEEVAIAYGYENFKPEIPDVAGIGSEDEIAILKRKVSEVLIGLGLLEISTFHLSTKEKQFKNIGIKEFRDLMIEVEDSKTENNILRYTLMGQAINILSENSDSAYPQKLFEIGKIFENEKNGIKEQEVVCVTLCDEKADFTEVKQVLDYLMRMFDKKYEIKETEFPSFIDGRCGKILVEGKDVGVIGEIAPFVLRNNGVRMPTVVLEMDIRCLI
jgi:phenylalanyl-tRNA synthetase beta chain